MSQSVLTSKPITALRIGIIGDYDARSPYHLATTEAIGDAANALSVSTKCDWIPTEQLTGETDRTILEPFDALWCAPGSPYKSMAGALRGIRYARENDRPFLGT